MLNWRFIRREAALSPHQSIIFVLCVTLSMVTLVSLGGFNESVKSSLLRDAKSLHAGDIIIKSNYEISKPLLEMLSSLEGKGTVESARVYDLYTVVRTQDNSSILADLKVVEKGYPFYGTLELISRREFKDVLKKGDIVVEQNLLDRLNLKIGDRLQIGSATLIIRDVVTKEPDRPVNIFSLGPRIFISADDLNGLDLIKKGSRVEHKALLKVKHERDLDRIVSSLRNTAVKGQEHVETYRTEGSRIKKFFDNLLFFLSMIGLFTLLLAGIGIQSSITSFLREREKTVAVMKSLGGTSRFITLNFIAIVSLIGAAGTILGIIISSLLLEFFPAVFKGMLPAEVVPAMSWSTVLQGVLLGTAVVSFFTFLPLYRLKEIRPATIFGMGEMRARKGQGYYIALFLILALSFGTVVWRLGAVKTGFYFLSGIMALIVAAALSTELILTIAKRMEVKNLIIRQALRGLFRPGNATRAIIVTLTASLTVISSIYLVERNLDADFISSYPDDAPNLFFLDIQPSQKDEFSSVLGMKAEYYPVIRARVSAINNEAVNAREEEKRMGDNFAREFNLTYREYLLPDEKIIDGKTLYRSDWKDVQVSVLDTVVEMRKMRVGDMITFNIQGVPLEARISSIRTRGKASIQPFFYFVFHENTLKGAPQNIFTAVKVEKDKIPELQNRMTARFPNVSAIDMTAVVSIFAEVMDRLSKIARFFTLFSIAAGILIIISSVTATRHARMQESVYFKILGARRGFVVKVFTLENLLLGLVSSGLALIFSQALSWIVCNKVLKVTFRLFAGTSLLIILATIVLATATGLLASISILGRRPVAFLREETRE